MKLSIFTGLLALFASIQGKKQHLDIKLPEIPKSLEIPSESVETCDPPCKNGKCDIKDMICICENGWYGKSCETNCAVDCVNGICNSPDTCICNYGWTGSSCEKAICDKECQNGGTCVSPNTCSCKSGFEGTLCQIALPDGCRFPFEYNGNIYSSCTTIDSTDGNAWCSTTTAYEGDRIACDFKSLCTEPGQFLEIPGDCNHFFTCIQNGDISLTTCSPGTVYDAFLGGCDYPQNTPHCNTTCKPECQNGGICVDQDECKCQLGFSGKHCETVEEILESGSDSGLEEGSSDISGDLSGSGSGEDVFSESYVCSIWDQENFYTFDGVLYNSNGRCGYQLVSDCETNQFDVAVTFDQVTHKSILTIKLGVDILVLSDGSASLNQEKIEIPVVLSSFKISRVSHTDYIIVNFQASNNWISWNGKDTYSVSLDKEKWSGKVCGLCGNMNGNTLDDMMLKHTTETTNDLEKFMDSWSLDFTCKTGPPTDYCGFLSDQQLMDATAACLEMVNTMSFETCIVPTDVLETTCLRSLCQCTSNDFTSCMCSAITDYSRLCVARGSKLQEWRSSGFCEKACPSNLVHMECGTACPSTCRNKNPLCTTQCVDGCFCPTGTYYDGEKCVEESECGCTHFGNFYPSGSNITSQCEECLCNAGMWECIATPCQGECAAFGDPHYRTFDGLWYTFSGECQYVLSTDACNGSSDFTFAVLGENVKCGVENTTCTKSGTIILKNDISDVKYQLKQNGVVTVDGVETKLPYSHGNVKISNTSSLMIVMKTSFGLEIEWDGAMRLYVKLDPSWQNKVCGMCGNFNSKSTDDFKTPDNLIETNAGKFGNSWKVNPDCPDVECHRDPILPESCIASSDKLAYAEEVCEIIRSNVFEPCHRYVDWGIYYYSCRSDVCSCGEGQECLCEVLADYARACAAFGIHVNWRNTSTCEVQCSEDMEYFECAGYCGITCKSLGDVKEVCTTDCQPGCVCKEGLYLNEDNTCVEIQDCSCYYQGQIYEPGANIIIDSFSCTCSNGLMKCEAYQEIEVCKSPEVFLDCSTLPKGSTGVACLPTCQDPKLFCKSEVQHCVSGCACPKGTIKDEVLKACVKPEECSCVHDGKIYKNGDVINPNDCNSCTCKGGKWTCTENLCPAECSVIGDPHFTTFDGKNFDFQGDCSYVLAENYCGGKSGSFRIVVETILCGNTGVTCTKAVTFNLDKHIIHLTKGDGEPIVTEGKAEASDVSYSVRKGTLYYIVETSIGVELLWNANNAVKVRVQPHLKSTVCGLCGNYDGDTSNDFTMRAGDVAADPNMFGNDWKVDDLCPDATYASNPCHQNPTRVPFAEKKCNIINSDVFEACHDKVDPSKFYENCLFDTCGCDIGGDCECFCTSVAAYAQECAKAGVCVSWRNNDVCPIMCEVYNTGFGYGEGFSSGLESGSASGSGSDFDTSTEEECEWRYEACGNPCPPTCQNQNPTSCPWERLEGCYSSCKTDEVWDYDTNKCINVSLCPPPPVEEPTTTTKPVTKPTPEITTQPTTPTTPPTTTTTTTAFCECTDSNNVTYAPGESWPLRGDKELCVEMTCVKTEPGVCKIESEDLTVRCTEQNKPVCENGFPAVQVQDGCKCEWQCQCYCFGQGDPHFFTFDGYYYPFQGNCTYVLSRDINSERSNFPHQYEIWMDNFACEEAPGTTCTKTISIMYNNTRMNLHRNYTYSINGKLHVSSSLPTNVSGIYLELLGQDLFKVTIDKIGLFLTYTGYDYSWSLNVPYSLFEDKTEGLCGVCNNDQTDDLTNRTGVVVTDEVEFAMSWLVFDKGDSCYKEPDECEQPAAKECELILKDLFKACHAAVDPQQFYEICLYDTSRCGNYSYCEALYGYARTCHHSGVCVDWRSDEVCPSFCPDNRVYQACKPNCEQQCSHFLDKVSCEAEELIEGCFCPEDKVEVDGECVDTSICTDCVFDGKIYEYGQSWLHPNDSCSICSCMEQKTVSCTKRKCPNGTNEVPDCESCFVPELVRGSDTCCPIYECVCNYIIDAGKETCDPVKPPKCDIGYIPVRTNPSECIPAYECECNTTKSPCPLPPVCADVEELVTNKGNCCSTYTCECKDCAKDTTTCGECENKVNTTDACGCKHYSCESRNVCRFNGTDKLVGEKWNPTVCQTCTCQKSNYDSEGCYQEECFTQTCSTSCPPCSEYRTVSGQCCGTCVAVGCEVSTDNGTTVCKDVGSDWVNYTECTHSTCNVNVEGHTSVTTNDLTCPMPELITCPTCYRVGTYVDNCCKNYECVPDDVCCLEEKSIKVPGEKWSPNTCTNCECTNKINETSGFHEVICEHIPCPSFDEETCINKTGGHAVPTDDGCCLKCDNKCIDDKNNTYLFGETWYKDNCTICSCAKGHEIVCNDVSCPGDIDTSIPNCDKCEVVRRRASSDPCCPQYDCVCNYDFGKGEPDCDAVPVPKCPPGYIPEQTNVGECIPKYDCICNMSKSPCLETPTCNDFEELVTKETDCCPLEQCVCKKCAEDTTSCSPCQETVITYDICGCKHISCKPKSVCLSGGILYNVSETWQLDVCTNCYCSSDFDSDTDCHYPVCTTEKCDRTCPPCHVYTEIVGQCCGECVQTGCHITHENGTTLCTKPGDIWSYTSNCTQYMCVGGGENSTLQVTGMNFTCKAAEIPQCGPCHLIESYVEDCCTKYRCVNQDVCCNNSIGKLPGSTWNPNACETCYCSEERDFNTGFYLEKCYNNPCPPIDEDACRDNGGMLTTTDDGCCMKCQPAECYECGRKISTSPEYMVVGECASTNPVTMSYCDGFCRGSYFWSEEGPDKQCSCCNPTTTVSQSVVLKCKNGSEVEHQYEDVLSCGCSATCNPEPPAVTPSPEAPITTAMPPTKPVPEPEESGSGSGVESGSGSGSGSGEEIICFWSNWMNSDKPKAPHLDDNETFVHIREAGFEFCDEPQDINCRPAIQTLDRSKPITLWEQIHTCDVNTGFLCLSSEQTIHPICQDYEIQVLCCGSQSTESGSGENFLN